MHYLGGLRGKGVLTCQNEALAHTDYDFDGFLTKGNVVISCGEIRMSPVVLREIFGRTNLRLRTDDGRLLDLRFSEKRLSAAGDTAHVDVAGELPLASEWRH